MATSDTNKKASTLPASYDTRVVQRNVGDGTLSPEDVTKFLESLPDVSGKSEPFGTRLRGGDAPEVEDDDADEAEG